MDESIFDRLELQYTTYIGNAGNINVVKLDNDVNIFEILFRTDAEKDLPESQLSINDVILKVRYILGDEIEKDCSCDSKYMLSAMERVGRAMRQKYYWISMNEALFLIMDNAGGHGTDEAIIEYTALLRDVYNINIIHQIPRSPFTNVLDLGVWVSLQARVEKKHFMKRCSVDALVNTVNRTWLNDSLNTSIKNVFLRLEKVLYLISEEDGANDLVETKRGVKKIEV